MWKDNLLPALLTQEDGVLLESKHIVSIFYIGYSILDISGKSCKKHPIY
jgi:hypothetical protein